MRLEWDPRKAKRNIKEHKVSFEQASEAFYDPHAVFAESNEVDNEERLQIIGMTQGLLLLLVIFVDRSSSDDDVLYRIISARKAEYFEEAIYENNLS